MALSALNTAPPTPTIEIDGRDVPLRLVRNRQAKRLILKVEHSTGEVVVVGPTLRALKQAHRFAQKERAWIEQALAKVPKRQSFTSGARVPLRGRDHTIVHAPKARFGVRLDDHLNVLYVSGEPEFVPRRVQDWLKRQAKTDLLGHVEHFTSALDLPLAKVTVRDTTTRWGSCSATGRLSFSWRLVLAPREILAYVAAHEVSHLVHMNHSKAFWAQVTGLVGDYAEAEEWLCDEGPGLHRYGLIK